MKYAPILMAAGLLLGGASAAKAQDFPRAGVREIGSPSASDHAPAAGARGLAEFPIAALSTKGLAFGSAHPVNSAYRAYDEFPNSSMAERVSGKMRIKAIQTASATR